MGAAGGLLGDLLEATFQNGCGVDRWWIPTGRHTHQSLPQPLRVQKAPGMKEGWGAGMDVCAIVPCRAMPSAGGGEGAMGYAFGNDHLHWVWQSTGL